MPKESITPIEGGGSPDFTAPSPGVATPGRQLQAQPTGAQDFYEGIRAFGRGAATAVSARASIQSRLKSLKEQSMRKVEADLRRSAMAFQARRLSKADAERQQILVEAGSRGMEWAEREFRSRMVNSSSTEESHIWEGAWSGAAAQVSRENEQARRQAFNSAKMSMTEVSLQLQGQLAEDLETRSRLTGDGSGIAARVQNWMLEELEGSVNLESMTQEDAELLIHQSIVQSAGIADKLRSQFRGQVEGSNLMLGSRQMLSDVISTATGEQDSSHLSHQIEVTLRDRLSHLSIEQQQAFVREQVSSALGNIANGSLGISAADGVANVSKLLKLEIHNQPIFNMVERQALIAELRSTGQRTIQREAEAAVAKLREATRLPVLGAEGLAFRPNPGAEAALLLPDEAGLDAFDYEAERILAEQGLLGLSSPSPEQSLMIATVRGVMAQQRAGHAAATRKAATNEANWVAVMTGGRGDGSQAHLTNPFTRARMTPAELKANDLAGLSSEDTMFLRTAMEGMAATDTERMAIANWDGSPLPYTEENQDLHRLMAMSEARQWQEGEIQAVTGLPRKLVDDKLALMRSNDPLRVEAFLNFATMLDSGAGEGWDNFLSAVSANEAAAATWVRQHGRLGQPGTGQAVAEAPLNLMDQVQTILTAPDVGSWLRTDTGTEDVQERYSNAREMADVLAAIIEDENGDVDFNEDGNLAVQINNMILSGRNSTGRAIRQLWFAGRAVNPTMENSQVGAMIWNWMRKDGLRFKTINDQVVMVTDPVGYLGDNGANINRHVQEQFMREFTPEYRSFLQEALDIDPKDVPFNVQHLLMENSTLRGKAEDAFARVLTPEFNPRDQSSSRMLESRANYGGAVVNGRTVNGVVLAPVVSTKDAILTWPDGSSTLVRTGTVLNVINPDLFVRPIEEEPDRPFDPYRQLAKPAGGY